MRSISVVIPARNAERTLPQQLDALARQTVDAAWEVVVADNGSTDRTRTVAESFAARMHIHVVDASGAGGAGAARNIGARAAQGHLLLFTDADDVVAPGWIAAYARADSMFATGPVPPWRGDFSWSNITGVAASPPILLRFRPYAAGSNLAVSRDVFMELRGFDESYLAGEDVEFSWRAQLRGVDLAYVHDAVVACRRLEPGQQFRQYRRYGIYDAALYRAFHACGVPTSRAGDVIRVYGGIVVRLPLFWNREMRSKVVRQFGRRVGRIAGSLRYRVLYL
jgi:glycosyltransferase involved in cell wall biosynthesis